MISSVAPIALSGLESASKRLETSSSNIANQFSTSSRVNGQQSNDPYVPRQVEQTSLKNGGVKTETRDQKPASVARYAPDVSTANEDSIALFPNVNTEQEVVNQELSVYTFKANLKSLEAADEMTRSTLNIIT